MTVELIHSTELEHEEFFKLFIEWDKSYPFDKEIFYRSLMLFDNTINKIILAKDKNQYLGYAQITKTLHIGFDPYYEVSQLLVSEQHRNKGIGKAIMLKVEEIANSESINTIKLSSQVHRSKAHVFYENLGYELNKISKYYQKGLR